MRCLLQNGTDMHHHKLSNDGRSHRRYKHPAHKQQPRIILRGLRISGTEKGNLASRHLLKYYGVDPGNIHCSNLIYNWNATASRELPPQVRPIQTTTDILQQFRIIQQLQEKIKVARQTTIPPNTLRNPLSILPLRLPRNNASSRTSTNDDPPTRAPGPIKGQPNDPIATTRSRRYRQPMICRNMEPTTILDKITDNTLILIYEVGKEQDEQIIALLREYADGLTRILTERPKTKLIVTLTFRSEMEKEKLTNILQQRTQKKTQKKEPEAKGKTILNQDPQRLHILVPRTMPCKEAIDILKEYGEIDFYDIIEMDKRPPKVYAMYVRYCTQKAADQARKTTAFTKEIRPAPRWVPRNQYRLLPREYVCLYCHHKATLCRKESHDEICSGQQPQERWRNNELRRNTIRGLKTYYLCGQAVRDHDWKKPRTRMQYA
ncbi:unnamed protein product [Trichogramma brassicae]|uniref:Uncharacterized protein n=1 Tax=Trichogramma brassicae TaxID=86971 RepID=A0A6H5J7A4_9HYME|nr:unnamed protein product [Trichogramma brassicae]